MHGGEGEAPAASGRGGELEGVAQGSGARPHGPVSEDTRSRGLIAAQKEAGSAFSAPAAAGAGASGRTLRPRRGGGDSPRGKKAPGGGAPPGAGGRAAGAWGRPLRRRGGGEISPGEEAPVAAAPLRARGAGRAGLDGSGSISIAMSRLLPPMARRPCQNATGRYASWRTKYPMRLFRASRAFSRRKDSLQDR